MYNLFFMLCKKQTIRSFHLTVSGFKPETANGLLIDHEDNVSNRISFLFCYLFIHFFLILDRKEDAGLPAVL